MSRHVWWAALWFVLFESVYWAFGIEFMIELRRVLWYGEKYLGFYDVAGLFKLYAALFCLLFSIVAFGLFVKHVVAAVKKSSIEVAAR